MFFLQTDVPAGDVAASGGLVAMLMPFLLVGVLFYFMLIRPQQKQQKQRKAMLDALKKGDRVVTMGGIYGELVALKEDYVTLKIADKVEVKLSRGGIGNVVKD